MSGSSLREAIRLTPPAVWALYAGTFLNRFGTFVVVYIVLYVTGKGYSAPQAGLAASAFGVGAFLASPVGGLLADRFGRRNSIALSMFASAATMLGLSQADSLWLIVAVSVVAGFAMDLYRPASSALLADLIPPERRVVGFGLYRFAINLGWAAGPAVAGFLAGRGFFLLFVGDAATSIAFGLIALLLLPHGVRSERAEERRGEATRAMIADRRFLLLLSSLLATALVYAQAITTFALHVRDQGLSPAVYGALLSLNGLVIVFLELPITSITRRFPPHRVIALGAFLVGAGFALNTIAHAASLLAAGVVVWTFGEMVGAPVGSAYVADLAPERLRGRYQAASGMTWGIAAVLAPIIGGTLYASSPVALWSLAGALGMISALLALASGRIGHRPDRAG